MAHYDEERESDLDKYTRNQKPRIKMKDGGFLIFRNYQKSRDGIECKIADTIDSAYEMAGMFG